MKQVGHQDEHTKRSQRCCWCCSLFDLNLPIIITLRTFTILQQKLVHAQHAYTNQNGALKSVIDVIAKALTYFEITILLTQSFVPQLQMSTAKRHTSNIE